MYYHNHALLGQTRTALLLTDALTLDGSDEYLRDDSPDISYNASGTYTFMLVFKMPNSVFQSGFADQFIYYRSIDNANRFRIQGENGGSKLQAVFGNQTVTLNYTLTITNLNILFIKFDSSNNIYLYDSTGSQLYTINSTNVVIPRFDLMQEIYYGRNALDAGAPRFSGTIAKISVWSKGLSTAEMTTEADNWQSIVLVNGSHEDAIIFNSNLFSENGTNVLLSNQITGSNIKAFAFNGASTSDQLADLQNNHLTDINSL